MRIVFSIVIVVGLWGWAYFELKDWDKTNRGTFGSVNALFSGLAFAGIILTILFQRKELSLQRQELKDTRAELKRAANAQEKSKLVLNRQAVNFADPYSFSLNRESPLFQMS